MALTSTLGSPGIEIREVNNAYYLNPSTATTVFVPGFASQGPVDEVMTIGSITDFETIYGVPTNAAERYFYYTVKALLDGAGAGVTVLTSRLPYGSGAGDTVTNAYTLLAYPAVPVIKKKYPTTTGKYETFDFDQYRFTSTGTEATSDSYKFLQLFSGISTASRDTISVEIDEYLLSLDDDTVSTRPDTLTIKKMDAADIPESDAVITTTDDSIIPAAPTLYFNYSSDGKPTYTAKGIIGTEEKENEKGTSDTFVHLSYTIFNASNKKCGSMYIKLKYSSNKIIGGRYTQASSASVSFTFKEAYEIAASYQGQSEEQFKDKDIKVSEFSQDVTYIIGSPVTYQISLNDYYKLITGESLTWSRRPYVFDSSSTVSEVSERWEGDTIKSNAKFGDIESIGHSAFIAINTSRSIINNNFEGFYLGITDNMFVTPSDDYTYNAIESVKITTKYYDDTEDDMTGLMDKEDNTGDFHTLNSNRLSFYLDSNYQGSISSVLTRNITSMDISSTEFDDTINMGLFKLSKSATSSDILKLNYNLREKYNWSFGKTRVKSSPNATFPVSYFVENVIDNSSNITVLMNPYISSKSFIDTDAVAHGKIRVYGNKLKKNLDNYEAKYLLRDYTTLNNNTTESAKRQSIQAIYTSRMAKSSINSWKSMVSQAGVTPSILKEFETENDYKNFNMLNSIMPFGTYTESTNSNKIIGSLPKKIQRSLELVENDEQYPDIDIVMESGLGTVYAYSRGTGAGSESPSTSSVLFMDESGNTNNISDEEHGETVFDENIVMEGVEDLRTGRSSLSDAAQEFVEDYRAVQDVFTQFANSMQNGGRGDCFYISDVPRGVFIKGKNTKVTELFGSTVENNAYDFGDNVSHSFSTSIYYPIKHTFDTIVSSYMSTYAQWVKILDSFSGEKVWMPISGYIAGNMAATDGTYGPWYAAAGLRRGVISGVLDYAFSPSTSQRTDLYKICINSVPKIPNYGVTIWGIRTMSKAASAFDQNTCRRTFLYMEKKVKQALRYYIFEPNTSYTRLQIVNEIDPFLEKVKNAGGIYSYTLVCDTSNNSPDVINNGDLAVSIAAAPTRTAENIVVEFIANKYTEEVSASESVR